MNDQKLIISVSGLRGVLGSSFRPAIVSRFVCAYASEFAPSSLVIGRDGRASGEAIGRLVSGALQLAGHDVLDAGIAATPTVGRLVRQNTAAGAVQITASHNPQEYNGLKLFRSDGRVLTATEAEQVFVRYSRGDTVLAAHDKIGTWQKIDDPITDHQTAILAHVDVDRIREAGFRVLIDSNCGAGGALAQSLLRELGCDVITLGAEATGKFLHPPEPTAANLQAVCQQVAQGSVAVGFCQDPDADRLALVDAEGQYIGEEYTLAICVDHVLSQRQGPIVTNCSTSRMTEEIAQRAGVQVFRSKVGEANVVDRMLEVNAVFGGEGNGGPIEPRVGYVRDSFVGMAMILDAMAATGKTVRELADALPRYYLSKSSVSLDKEKFDEAARLLKRQFSEAKPDELDGLRLDWPDRWLLVRPSNTEPIVRIFAEASSAVDAERLTKETASLIAMAR